MKNKESYEEYPFGCVITGWGFREDHSVSITISDPDFALELSESLKRYYECRKRSETNQNKEGAK